MLNKGVSFNTVSSDMIQTKFLSKLPEAVLSSQIKVSKSILQIEEIAPVFEFLLSASASAIHKKIFLFITDSFVLSSRRKI